MDNYEQRKDREMKRVHERKKRVVLSDEDCSRMMFSSTQTSHIETNNRSHLICRYYQLPEFHSCPLAVDLTRSFRRCSFMLIKKQMTDNDVRFGMKELHAYIDEGPYQD